MKPLSQVTLIRERNYKVRNENKITQVRLERITYDKGRLEEYIWFNKRIKDLIVEL